MHNGLEYLIKMDVFDDLESSYLLIVDICQGFGYPTLPCPSVEEMMI